MLEDKMKKSWSEIARLIAEEDTETFKIVVVPEGYSAHNLVKLLTRSHNVPKKHITQLGYGASDERNDTLLQQQKPIVVVPIDILRYRPCLFHPPSGATQVAIIKAAGDSTEVSHRACSDEPFRLEM